MSVPSGPVSSIAEAIARMQAIAASLPPADGIACFNRMYLDVTRQVNGQISQGFFADPAFMTDWSINSARDLAWNKLPAALGAAR